MLDAHSDEVGFMVQSINPDGTLTIIPLGGWNTNTLSSSRVIVRNSMGAFIPGVIASKTIQNMDLEERKNSLCTYSKLSVDIGSSSFDETVDSFGIDIGDSCAPEGNFVFDEKRKLLWGKAFDCRLGCAALIETMKRLQGEPLPIDIVGVFSTQEELGERGCRVAITQVHPQIAICFEGSPADDTFVHDYKPQTALKKGAMFRFFDKSIVCSPRFQRFVLDTAKNNNISIQKGVRKHGGNNASVINTAYDGVPVVVAGIPVRYTHTCLSLASYEDFELTVQIVTSIVRSLTREVIDSF